MSYLAELEQTLANGQEPSPKDMLRMLVRVASELGEDRRQAAAKLRAIDERLLLVDDLPASAPFGALIRLRGDQTGALYTGNGPGRPLGKLTPTAV